MSQSVTIKSNKYGINLILSPEAAFDELLEAIIEKFKASANFFKNAKLAISFEGRQLSDDEQQQIIAAIEENTTIEILCVVENGTRQERTYADSASRVTTNRGCSACDVCYGLMCADCCCECLGGDLISCC